MEILNIKFAPLNVPLKRRLETLSVAIVFIWMAAGNLWGYLITGYLLFYTQTIRYFMIFYFLWMYYDWDTRNKGGRGDVWCRWFSNRAILRHFVDYFPVTLVKTVDLDPNKRYLFCSVPHGVLSLGMFSCFATAHRGCRKLFPGLNIRTAILDQHFKIPVFHDYVLLSGGVSSNAESLSYQLSGKVAPPFTGTITNLMIGGAAEVLENIPRTYRILIKRRKGFVRIGLMHGGSLVPVVSFGETDMFDQVYGAEGTRLKRIQHYIRKWIGIPPAILIGRGFFQYSFGFVPRRTPITVVVGSPIDLPKIPEPTQEQIDEYHAKFIDKLEELFETHKHKYVENADSVHLEYL